jgi:bacteriocin-like protein
MNMNKPEEQAHNVANELSNVPNPPVEELSEDELNKIAGGAQVDMFLKLDGIKGEVSHKGEITVKSPINFKPGG